MKTTHLLTLSLLVTLTACLDGTSSKRPSNKNIELQRFSSCAEIEKLGNVSAGKGGGLVLAGAPEASDSGNSSAPKGETNLQVEGVDEMDSMKADGNFIYAIKDSKLLVLRRSPAAEAAVVQTVDLGSSGSGLFVSADRVTVLESLGGYGYGGDPIPLQVSSAGAVRSTVCLNSDCGGYTASQVRVESFLRSDDGSLEKESSRDIDGTLADARMIGSHLHLVLSSYLPVWDGVDAIEGAMPTTASRGDVRNIATCNSILKESAAADDSVAYPASTLLCAVSLEPDHLDHDPSSECIATAYTSVIYASKENLFVAGGSWSQDTPIHQFRLATDDQPTTYVGSALVSGWLVNQFAMDEYEGHLRVATTTFGTVDSATDDAVGISTSLNQVAILKLGESNPERVGLIDAIAPGEQIYAARFMGDQGFVVTFRQVDPLFTMDLSDPTDPKIMGELKIPGYSTYLHPMKPGYLLGIGVDQGVSLSIFDVRDLTAPTEVQKLVISSSSYSEALYDHKAVRFDAATNLLILPIQIYDGVSDFFNGFKIFEATVEGGFELVGSSALGIPIDSWDGLFTTARSFIHDGGISMLGVDTFVTRSTSSPDTDVARITLP